MVNRFASAVVVWSFGAVLLVASGADDIPSAFELVDSHATLREYARSVQGHFSLYRDDSPVSSVVLGDSDEVTLPLMMEGELWRAGESYRLKGTRYTYVDGKAEGSAVSIAVTPVAAYEFVSESDDKDAILRISALGTTEYNTVRDIGLNTVIAHVDSLWSTGGRPIAEMLQRPDASLRGGRDGAIEIEIALGPNENTLYRLNDRRPFPLVVGSNQTTVSDSSYSMTYTVESSDVNEVVLPRRIVEEFSVGDSVDYTEVAILELKPIGSSDILSQLNANSFRDMGIPYQVYRIKSDAIEEVGERIGDQQRSRKSSRNWTTKVFIAVALVLASGVILLSLKTRKKP